MVAPWGFERGAKIYAALVVADDCAITRSHALGDESSYLLSLAFKFTSAPGRIFTSRSQSV
jgi:hypothetical protein